MNSLEEKLKVIEGYCELVSASEQEKCPEIERLKKQMDTFEEDRETMTKMCEDIDKLEKEKVSVRQLVDEMHKCKKQLSELEERYAELNTPLEYSESKQKQLFEKYMGLQFKLTEDKAISLVFTNINENDPDQRFVITLDVDENNQWKVVHLEPSVHGVQSLINELNQTSEFGKFCKKIRQKFQQLCSEPTTSS